MPKVVNLAVDQNNGDLVAKPLPELGIVVDILLDEDALAGQRFKIFEHAKHNDPGIITQMTTRAAEQEYVGNDYFLLRR